MMMMGGGMVLFFLSFIIMFSLLACAVLSRIRFINYYVLLCAFFTFFSFFFSLFHILVALHCKLSESRFIDFLKKK